MEAFQTWMQMTTCCQAVTKVRKSHLMQATVISSWMTLPAHQMVQRTMTYWTLSARLQLSTKPGMRGLALVSELVSY